MSIKYTYKCKLTNEVHNEVDLTNFIGYKIQREQGKLSYITEYSNNKVLGKITYRPTKIPIIMKVNYNGYTEERYNNNKVSSVHYNFQNQMYGEYRKYSTSGILLDMKYYYASTDVTDDIMKFIHYSGNSEDFKFYELKEDEMFNVMIRYGSYFKLFDEYNMDSKHFDYITEYCLQ